MTDLIQRLRDPIHGLIVFREDNPVDMLAWRLIETPEFQRLRRIRQLGVSEFVYPGATHTRFTHSIGVYHNARKLMEVIRRAEGTNFNTGRQQVVLIAALLHDLGHGPFSHAFEGARAALARTRTQDAIEKHEKFTAKLILDPDGGIRPILDKSTIPGFADDVAHLIAADDPIDIYHAVVSSSFDADRLDYLVRDRYMTGTGAGSIDADWLIDNLSTWEIPVWQDDDPDRRPVPTFVFKQKGRQAAEDFLLARHRLYTQVYLHKTTRGFEQLVSALIRRIGELSGDPDLLGLDHTHPLLRFLRPGGETLDGYRDLDDTAIWGAVDRLRHCQDPHAQTIASRLRNREALKVLDVSAHFGHDEDKLHNARRKLQQFAQDKLGQTVFRDEPPLSLYSRHGGEVRKQHKMVRVRTGDGGQKEITDFPNSVISPNLMRSTKLTRYYFLSSDDRDDAEKIMRRS